MKASEMTNVQIADYILSLQSDVDGFPFSSNEIIREAAARLRKLKVAEDAGNNNENK